MQNEKIQHILNQNDRKGERAIALMQGGMALTIFLLHIISASKNNWETLSLFTIAIAALILFASLKRARDSYAETLSNLNSHILTVIDGILIYALMLSYNQAYQLPLEATFKTPTVVFLVVYSVVRIMRSDPWAIIVAGATVLAGWLGIFSVVMMGEPNLASTYSEYISSDKMLVGAVFEYAIGYTIVILMLALFAKNARQFVTKTAHVEDLAIANLKAEENIRIFEDLLSSSVDGVVIVDGAGNIERLNPATEELFEYDAGELLGKNVSLLMSDENASLLRNAVQTYIETKKSDLVGHSFSSVGVKKDGTQFQIELSISEFNASGKTCFAGFIRDASEKSQVLANEKRVTAQFENAMNAAMDAIIIINQDGKITHFNPSAEAIFGHDADAVIGEKLSNVIIPDRYREAHDNGMEHYLKTGEGPVLNSRIEIEGLHKDGHELQIELAIREIEGADGKLFLGYARDITERKMSEAKLLDAKNSAEVATQAKTRFLAMMSHEIRTPLNGVLGIHGLLKETKLDDDQQQLLATASESGQSLLSLINDLLDFSKLEAGKFDIEEKPFSIRGLVNSVVSLTEPHIQDKGLKLKHHIDDTIDEVLLGDVTRIRQILLNLTWNAFKFTEEGHIEIAIHKTVDNAVKFSVKDTGIGIAKENHGDLFAEFSAIDANYSAKFGGTGLGLAICKALVEAMGGEIGFESELNAGSQFWVTLKLETGDASTYSENKHTIPNQPTLDLSGLNVLVAEDNKTNQLVTTRYLKHYGSDVEIANNGLEAVEKTLNGKFDVILMDISMPEMDGFEATKAIKDSSDYHCPIIALTAYASKEDEEKVLQAGMDGFISKPFAKEQLAMTIIDLVGEISSAPSTQKHNPKIVSEPFDKATLDSVLEDMDEDSLITLFAEFNNDLQRYLKSANEGLENKDPQLLESASHGLQGVSGMFGAKALSSLASEVNQICKSDDQETLYELAVNLINTTQEIIEQTDDVKERYIRDAKRSN